MTDLPWTYVPQFSPKSDKWLQRLIRKLEKIVTPTVYEGGFKSSRESCFFSSEPLKYDLPTYDWKHIGSVNRLKKKVEKFTGLKFDYCLAHIYPNGSSTIAWHRDSEAMFTDVVSVSFGASRKFRLRDIQATKGWDHEYVLNNGDLLHMHKGCQNKYKHTVPAEKRITAPRINFTFRKFESVTYS
jgi:hypothetical protein